MSTKITDATGPCVIPATFDLKAGDVVFAGGHRFTVPRDGLYLISGHIRDTRGGKVVYTDIELVDEKEG